MVGSSSSLSSDDTGELSKLFRQNQGYDTGGVASAVVATTAAAEADPHHPHSSSSTTKKKASSSSSTSAIDEPQKKKGRGLSYPKPFDAKATGINRFPFIVERDQRDVEIFRQLNSMKACPWERINETTTAWDELAAALSRDDVVNDKGEKIYPTKVRGSTIKKRVMDVLEGYRSFHSSATHRSGEDDEPTNDFIRCVDDVSERYYDWVRDSSEKKENELAKEEERNLCEGVMRDVAAGRASRKDVESAAKRKRASSPASSSHGGRDAGIAADLQELLFYQEEERSRLAKAEAEAAERQRKSLEIAEMKANVEAQKIQNEAKRLELEERKLTLEEKKFAAQEA